MPDELRDALVHIGRMANGARVPTNRLRAIGLRARMALAGEPFDPRTFEHPKHVETEYTRLNRRYHEQAAELAQVKAERDEAVRLVRAYEWSGIGHMGAELCVHCNADKREGHRRGCIPAAFLESVK